jgi:hypothetical protein
MKLLDRLERKWGHLAIPNLTSLLIGGQVLVFIFTYVNPQYAGLFSLHGAAILQGQWWRLATFLLEPISRDLIFVIFAWYLYYIYGTALEVEWGAFRYMVYVLTSYLATVLLAFIFPDVVFTNAYLYLSLFLAFAYLFPNFELQLLFIIPVKIKWLAVLAWITIAGSVLVGSIPTKVLAVVGLANFALFFGQSVLTNWKLRLHHQVAQTSQIKQSGKAFHTCGVCGRNEVDNPDMEIRYCSDCIPETCYCERHINTHRHKMVN